MLRQEAQYVGTGKYHLYFGSNLRRKTDNSQIAEMFVRNGWTVVNTEKPQKIS